MKVFLKLGNQEKLEKFWETYILKTTKTNLNFLEHIISRNIGVNNFSTKDSERNEDHKRENLNHFIFKYLNPNEQTLSWYMDVKGATGEDSGGDKKHSIRNLRKERVLLYR